MAKIICSISSCTHNVEARSCSLEEIKIGTHEANPTQVECTDCESFELGK